MKELLSGHTFPEVIASVDEDRTEEEKLKRISQVKEVSMLSKTVTQHLMLSVHHSQGAVLLSSHRNRGAVQQRVGTQIKVPLMLLVYY